MPNVRVAIIDKASREFRPIIADFPIDGKLLYGLFASGEIEDSDNPLFYAARQLMDIPQKADCIYGVYLHELRDPDGNLIPDQNPDFTELDFRADLYSRWLNARAGFQRCAFARR